MPHSCGPAREAQQTTERVARARKALPVNFEGTVLRAATPAQVANDQRAKSKQRRTEPALAGAIHWRGKRREIDDERESYGRAEN